VLDGNHLNGHEAVDGLDGHVHSIAAAAHRKSEGERRLRAYLNRGAVAARLGLP
jgi:hypothetical protein